MSKEEYGVDNVPEQGKRYIVENRTLETYINKLKEHFGVEFEIIENRGTISISRYRDFNETETTIRIYLCEKEVDTRYYNKKLSLQDLQVLGRVVDVEIKEK